MNLERSLAQEDNVVQDLQSQNSKITCNNDEKLEEGLMKPDIRVEKQQ